MKLIKNGFKLPGPLVLVVMDGIGEAPKDEGNAVALARTPNLDALKQQSLYRTLKAHGKSVGLPSDDDMGNSEVGHNALGAGRIYQQGASLVESAIQTGKIFEGNVWKKLLNQTKPNGTLHFIGLLSDGNVHSHIDHLLIMMKRAVTEGIKKLRIHPLLDGRDVPETSALFYVERLESLVAELNAHGADVCVASGGGRMTTTMDRYEAEWSMVERGWHAHVHGVGPKFDSLTQAIETMRQSTPGISDQNLPHVVIADHDGQPLGKIRDGDAVVFFNFRGDRAIEITRAFSDPSFSAFDRGYVPKVFFAGMMQYDGDLKLPTHFLVNPPHITLGMSELLVQAGVSQMAISETQKYGHVTYFWNGNRSGTFDPKLETYIEIPSDTLPFEERPWMKAAEITDRVIQEMNTKRHQFIRLNYANGDMVGHTGHRDAAILAVECVDLQLGRLWHHVMKLGGALMVTADHGNADEMFEKNKQGSILLAASGKPKPKTSHTLNPVPWMLDGVPQAKLIADPSYGLSHVASSVFELLGYKAPEHMDPGLINL